MLFNMHMGGPDLSNKVLYNETFALKHFSPNYFLRFFYNYGIMCLRKVKLLKRDPRIELVRDHTIFERSRFLNIFIICEL